EPFSLTWPRLAFCRMTMRSSDWRGNRDDAAMVPANESTGACARVGGGRHGACVIQPVCFGLGFRRAGECTKANRDAQSNVSRAGSLCERTRTLDQTR